jgi:hypothetical protein
MPGRTCTKLCEGYQAELVQYHERKIPGRTAKISQERITWPYCNKLVLQRFISKDLMPWKVWVDLFGCRHIYILYDVLPPSSVHYKLCVYIIDKSYSLLVWFVYPDIITSWESVYRKWRPLIVHVELDTQPILRLVCKWFIIEECCTPGRSSHWATPC